MRDRARAQAEKYNALKRAEAIRQKTDPAIIAAKERAATVRNRKQRARFLEKNPGAFAAMVARKRINRKFSLTQGNDMRGVAQFYDLVRSKEWLRCYYCLNLTPINKRQVDHVIPLAKHGPHALWNLCCACDRCNAKKHSQTPLAFSMRRFGQLLLDL